MSRAKESTMSPEEIATELQKMLANPALITKPGFRANGEQWPNNVIPFVDDHLDYLSSHRNINPAHYLMNLRLQLRRR
jgi:hypothetical protein